MGQEVFIYKQISKNYYEDGQFHDYMKGPGYKYGKRVRFGEKKRLTSKTLCLSKDQ